MKQARRGFTLIELLVVIGIIMILISLLILGFRHLNQAAGKRDTIADLHVLRGILTDYERTNGFVGIEQFAGSPPTLTTDNSAPGLKSFPVYPDPATSLTPTTATLTNWQSIPLTDVTGDMGDKASASSLRYASNADLKTRDVMYVLLHLPSNRNLVQAMPPKRILEGAPGTSANQINQGPVLLDSWGNPMIFVPRGGLHVNIKDQTGTSQPYIVRSNGTFPVTGTDPPLTGAERPFWASAGQDGDFSIGEDNIYSFQE